MGSGRHDAFSEMVNDRAAWDQEEAGQEDRSDRWGQARW